MNIPAKELVRLLSDALDKTNAELDKCESKEEAYLTLSVNIGKAHLAGTGLAKYTNVRCQ